MAWYWWVLIAIGVIAAGVLKLKVLSSIMSKRKQKKQQMELEE